ncbi:hypothetical protein F511_20113 [Dorcoceras hygrometricum]|uniref:Uncharacterized protein n=1 Tax=Dorcoceras hygrometricum TaxID=472368 RepID=A0A2Z7ARV5_9LAMI|nr:hypothetical protein F511_20113 [Dorcoceras hygrometricum]
MKPSGDKFGLGYDSDESSTAEPSTHQTLDMIKFQKMNFVKSSMGQPEEEKSYESKIEVKPQIWQGRYCRLGYTAPEKSKESWLKKCVEQMRDQPKSGGRKLGQFSKAFMKDRQYRPKHHKPRYQGKPTAYQKNFRSKHSQITHVNFESVLSMDDAVTIRMFRSLEKSGLRRFLGVFGSVFDEALNQFFTNAAIIAGTIVSTVANRKMVITKDVFSETFHLLSEGIVSFSGFPVQAVADMKVLFSTTDIPFKPSSKKKDMKFAKVEDLLFSWEETEKVSEFLQKRELIWFKMVEQHLRKAVAEHWKEFNKDKPSANQDLMSIRMLEAESAKDRATYMDITPGISWQDCKAQLVQLTFSASAEQPAQAEEQQALAIEQPAKRRSTRLQKMSNRLKRNRLQKQGKRIIENSIRL